MNKNLNKRINRTIIPVWKTYLYMKIKTYSMQWEVELCSFIYTCKKHLTIVFFQLKKTQGSLTSFERSFPSCSDGLIKYYAWLDFGGILNAENSSGHNLPKLYFYTHNQI